MGNAEANLHSRYLCRQYREPLSGLSDTATERVDAGLMISQAHHSHLIISSVSLSLSLHLVDQRRKYHFRKCHVAFPDPYQGYEMFLRRMVRQSWLIWF